MLSCHVLKLIYSMRYGITGFLKDLLLERDKRFAAFRFQRTEFQQCETLLKHHPHIFINTRA